MTTTYRETIKNIKTRLTPRTECAPRILLIEDDQALNHALSERLSYAGMEVTSAWDGRSARRAVNETEFDVVLLDLGLPDVHGLELIAELIERCSERAIIVLTGGEKLDCGLARLNGAQQVLQKPAPHWLVVDAIRNALTA